MNRLLRCVLLVVLLWSPIPAAAEYLCEQLNYSTYGSGSPQLATSSTGLTLVAWTEWEGDDGETRVIYSQLVESYVRVAMTRHDPVCHGPGHSISVCWSQDGFTLAMIREGSLILYQSDPTGHFDPEEYEIVEPYTDGFSVYSVDLHGVDSGGVGPQVLMTVSGTITEPEINRVLLFRVRSNSVWWAFEVVGENLEMILWPQIVCDSAAYGFMPTIYYSSQDPFTKNGETGVVYTSLYPGTGWVEPTTIPLYCPIEEEFDVAHGGLGQRSLLGLGPAMTCPCGSIMHLGYDEATGWTDCQGLTIAYDGQYDWPMGPNVKIDSEGRVHAFWYQLATSFYYGLQRPYLEYWVRDGDSWSDEGDFLNGQAEITDREADVNLSSGLALDLTPEGHPVLAWGRGDVLEGVVGPKSIWIARYVLDTSGGVDETPRNSLMLTTHPNPFNPHTTISFDLPQETRARLRVFDISGRLVRTLLNDERVQQGRNEVFWNGRDDRGRQVSSDVYFYRLETKEFSETRKMVMIR